MNRYFGVGPYGRDRASADADVMLAEMSDLHYRACRMFHDDEVKGTLDVAIAIEKAARALVANTDCRGSERGSFNTDWVEMIREHAA